MQYAKVLASRNHKHDTIVTIVSDSCSVDNGGCGENAECTHDSKTFAVRCVCKTGYTNIGVANIVRCEGELITSAKLIGHLVRLNR